jgi:hypothetical protein
MTPKQQSDPVIDEVREVRRRISEQCGHDPDRLVAYYMEFQQQFRDRMIECVERTAVPDQPAA